MALVPSVGSLDHIELREAAIKPGSFASLRMTEKKPWLHSLRPRILIFLTCEEAFEARFVLDDESGAAHLQELFFLEFAKQPRDRLAR
jgi:hypothetical protein